MKQVILDLAKMFGIKSCRESFFAVSAALMFMKFCCIWLLCPLTGQLRDRNVNYLVTFAID